MKRFISVFLVCALLFSIGFSNNRVLSQTNVKEIIGESINQKELSITIGSDDAADTVILDFLHMSKDVINSAFGNNLLTPGSKVYSSLNIINNSGEVYEVTKITYDADVIRIGRVYNGAAIKAGLTQEETAKLDGDTWYQLNKDFYGEENFEDLSTLRQMFGSGVSGQGNYVGLETSAQMIELGKIYFVHNVEFSLNTDVYPLEIRTWDTPTSLSQLIFNDTTTTTSQMFPNIIDQNGANTKIGVSINGPQVGSAYNGVSLFVGFQIELTKVQSTQLYRVDFDSQGGSFVGPILDIVGGSTILKPSNPTRTGYDFIGWYTSPNYDTVWDFNTDTVNEDKILYAKWTPSILRIFYELDGGSNDPSNPSTYVYGVGVNSFGNPSKTGYDFVGWIDLDGNPKASISTIENEDVTLIAIWSRKKEDTENKDKPGTPDIEIPVDPDKPDPEDNGNTDQPVNPKDIITPTNPDKPVLPKTGLVSSTHLGAMIVGLGFIIVKKKRD